MLLYLLQTQNCKVQNLVGLGDLHSEDLGRSFQHFCGQIHPCKTKALACTEADRFCGGEGRGGECRGGGGGGGGGYLHVYFSRTERGSNHGGLMWCFSFS